MSCGVRVLPSPIDSYWEREEMASRLYDRGEISYSEYSSLRHGDCLDSFSASRVERALDDIGMQKYSDYRIANCYCDDED